MQAQNVQHHALPGWFVRFQDTAGLSLLIVALMTINGVVYASGVVPDIEQPATWGIFGSVMFVAFFLAGAAMPGVALRAGAGMFVGEWYRRLACLLVSLLFFLLEIWCSITERSLNTITSPADRWLLSALHLVSLPFSPTVIAISVAISLIVIVWGLVTGVTAVESAEDVAHREELKTIKARAKAERWAVRAAGVGGAVHAGIDAAKDRESADESPVQSPDESTTEAPAIEAAKAGASRVRPPAQKAVPSHMMSAKQLMAYLDENDVTISEDKARTLVQSAPGFVQVGRTYYAPRRALMAVANRLIEAARTSANETSDAGALAG